MFVLHSHTLGGAEKHVLILSEMLKNNGHEVVFAGPKDSWLSVKLSSIGVDTFHIPMHGFYDLYSLMKLVIFFKKFRPDIVHGHLTRGAFYAGIASKVAGIPSVATAHSTNTWKHFRWVDRIVCVSNAVRDFLLSKGHPSDKLTTIYNGVKIPVIDSSVRDKLRSEWGIKENDIVFGMVSRVIYDKGHDIAIKAFKKAGIYAKIVVVGDYATDYGKLLIDMVKEYGMDDKVLFVGGKDNVFDYFVAFDVYLSPSRREAMPLAILEAISVGLPVVGSRVGGIPEIVKDRLNGMLFESENVDELAACMKGIAEDRSFIKKMSEQSKKVYEEFFDAWIMYRKIIDLYKSIRGDWNAKD
ncbi:MAG: glycosyltransferase [Calditerrivibrio sp.]|nr:glycosyltransferase [Calditerrivibrio sp.]